MAEVKIYVQPDLEVAGDTFQVVRYVLREALSEPSSLRCEVTELDAEPRNPGQLIGQDAKFRLRRTDGSSEREFLGRIVVAERTADEDDVRTLLLDIAPVPWALSKRTACRVFQKLSVVDIAMEVLSAAGVTSDRQDWRITGEHPEREYLVQYRETDLAFLHRILSEEGIYYAVHHQDGKDMLVFGDDPAGLGEIAAPTSLPYHFGAGFEEAIDRVMRLTEVHEVASDKAMLRDYNPDKPSLGVEHTAEGADGTGVLEVYDYPARCAEPPDAERLTGVLLDQLQRSHHQVHGEAGVLTLRPGLRFSVENHPYGALNQEYIVTALRIVGTTPRLGALEDARGGGEQQYRCEFSAIPSTTRCTAPYQARAADVVGLQTAFTTGPAGEEIHVNENGRVKVHYHWDRLGAKDETSSLWVRTSQLPTGGSMLLPRVGWEVSVDHLEGDPDRPLVMARMYNALAPPPYGLPGECGRSALQTATSPGGGSVNEFRMSDSAGSEEMFFNASKDMSIDVKNNTTESVGNDCSRSIGSNQTKNVTNSVTATVGGSQTLSVGANQSVKVETLAQDEVGGDHSLSIGGKRDMMIGGDHKRDVGADSKLDVGGMQIDLVVGSTTDETLGSFTHQVGAALVDITAADRSLTVGGSITETAGAAKIIAVKGGRGVEVGGAMTQQVAGAIINVASGDRVETAGATYSEIAAGAQLVKADNITIEAEGALTLVMGASILSLNPAMVTLVGLQLKLDGDTSDLGALVIDN